MQYATVAFSAIVMLSCQKMDKPSLADYPKDANPPGGPLKFYAAFNGTTDDPLMNAVDSIRANFPSDNPLASTDGISGKGIQCVDGKAIKYPTANDFKNSTSFTVAFWLKNNPSANTELFFSLVDPTYGWHNSAVFLLIEHQTASSSTFKFGLMDQWLEFVNENKFNKPLFDNNWHHLAIAYDENTSKVTYYHDGVALTGLPANVTDVKKGGAPRGKLDFSKATQLVIGGWNKHASITGPTDDWIHAYSGKMDQFRLYGKALTASEVAALFNGKM